MVRALHDEVDTPLLDARVVGDALWWSALMSSEPPAGTGSRRGSAEATPACRCRTRPKQPWSMANGSTSSPPGGTPAGRWCTTRRRRSGCWTPTPRSARTRWQRSMRPTSNFPISTAACTAFPTIGAGASLWPHGPRGAAAGWTCPRGGRCANPSMRRPTSPFSPSRSTSRRRPGPGSSRPRRPSPA